MEITELEARTPIERLERITPDEIKKLRAANIPMLGNLWSRAVGGDQQLTGFDQLAEQTKITSERLTELLPARLLQLLVSELLRRADALDLNVPVPPKLQRPSVEKSTLNAAKRVGHWLRRHLFDLILLFALISVGFLILRAAGILPDWPPPVGLSESVVVTRRDLKAGEVLQLDRDLSIARLPLKENYFKSPSDLEGLILRQDVSAQKPLRTENLERMQLVATKDIPGGEKIARDAVTLAWSPYNAKALLRPESAVDHKTRFAIRKDNIIPAEDIVP
jgi:hypothetical protein